MNILHSNPADQKISDGSRSPVTWVRTHLPQISEWFWFGLSFLLFILLGPFSAVVVLISLGSLASGEQRERMTEPAGL